MSDQDKVPIGGANIHEAERIRGRLGAIGIAVELAVSPGDCNSGGCGIRAEIWASQADLPRIASFFAEERRRQEAGLSYDPEVIAQVFDVDAAEATCPACATRFATTQRECPDCGLSFAIPEE